jgi:hypothetical protein
MRRKEAGRQRAHVRPTHDKTSLARDGDEWEPTQSPRGRGQQWTNSREGGCTWACNGAGGDDRWTDGQATVTDRQVWGWGWVAVGDKSRHQYQQQHQTQAPAEAGRGSQVGRYHALPHRTAVPSHAGYAVSTPSPVLDVCPLVALGVDSSGESGGCHSRAAEKRAKQRRRLGAPHVG